VGKRRTTLKRVLTRHKKAIVMYMVVQMQLRGPDWLTDTEGTACMKAIADVECGPLTAYIRQVRGVLRGNRGG
jgi:hypothetical protein